MNGESDDKNSLGVDQPTPSKIDGEPNDRDSSGINRQASSRHQTYCPGFLADLDWSRFPHVTFLPGLQFSLAGMLGKPQTFYQAGPKIAMDCIVLVFTRSVY